MRLQIPMVTRLARAFPNIAIVLCHEGSPVFAEGMSDSSLVESYETVAHTVHSAYTALSIH
jgi:hypothetical protein